MQKNYFVSLILTFITILANARNYTKETRNVRSATKPFRVLSFFSRYFVIILIFITTLAKPGRASAETQRIISLAPNITEILFALNADDKVVGVTDYCNYPPETEQKNRIGGLFNPNLEMIFALQPDLIIGLLSNAELQIKLESQNIPFLTVKNETIQEILDSIQQIGNAIGAENEAKRLIKEIRNSIVQKDTASDPISAMIVIGRDPGKLTGLYIAGKETFLSELLEKAGGENIFADIQGHYSEVSIEEVIRRNPQMIIELRTKEDAKKASQYLSEWQPLSDQLQAIKSKWIKIICEDYLMIPGPRLTLIFRDFQNIMQRR